MYSENILYLISYFESLDMKQYYIGIGIFIVIDRNC